MALALPRLSRLSETTRPQTVEAPTRLPAPSRLFIYGVPVDRVTMDYAVAWVIGALRGHTHLKPLLIMGPNAQLVTLAARLPRFAAALAQADLAVPDGISVVLAARLVGRPVPARLTGGDLMEQLCAGAAKHDLSVFFLGGLPGAAEKTARKFEHMYPGFRAAGSYCPPRGFENDACECLRIRQRIADARPDLLSVAFGAPKQELWMVENCPTLPIGAAIAVGAALDTQAGLRRRAPQWAQSIGCEWLYRLIREPRRLWRRYLVGNTYFLWLVTKERLRRPVTGRERFHSSPGQQERT